MTRAVGNLVWAEAVFCGTGVEREGAGREGVFWQEGRGRELLQVKFPRELKQAHCW